MYRYLSLSVCMFAFILEVKSASAPFIKPCKVTDNSCLTSSAQAAIPVFALGVPELGVHSIDPMALGTVKSDQGGLKLAFKDTIVTGLQGCTMESTKVNPAKGKLVVQVRCSVQLKGNYKLGGQLLILPVQGQGLYHIEIRDIVLKVTNDIKVVERDGKQYWEIYNKPAHTFKVKTSAHFHFDNLFNGNQALAEPVLSFANTNWRDVMLEIAPPIVAAIVDNVVAAVQEFFKAVPVDELTVI